MLPPRRKVLFWTQKVRGGSKLNIHGTIESNAAKFKCGTACRNVLMSLCHSQSQAKYDRNLVPLILFTTNILVLVLN